MSIFEIILISIGLAMDCFAVSVAGSIAYGKYNWRKILRIALFFGAFQGFMPLIGWALGVGFADAIRSVDHWLAMIILGFLGGKMIYEGVKGGDDTQDKTSPYGSLKSLILLSVATSIDALATGLIFVPLKNLIFTAMGIIFAVSFLFSILGCVVGIHFGKRFRFNVEAVGGLILIFIGVKILIEHLFF